MTQPDDTQQVPGDRENIVNVVGIGASAGGIVAMKQFFSHVPPDSGVAYAVILHLSPDHDSRLAEVLQTTAPIPVSQVNGRVRIEKNHVYVVPPNKTMEITNGHLLLKEITRFEQRRAPVDLFFRTLADTHGSRAVCVVLSGTGPNGSAGLKRVKEYGGLAIAQDPTEAEYSDMPRNSIATGLVDYILPVAQMPQKILAYLARLRQDSAEASIAAMAEDSTSMRDVLTLLRVRTGHDFSNYKTGTLQRRVERPSERAADAGQLCAADAAGTRRGGGAHEGAPDQCDQLLPGSARVEGARGADRPASAREQVRARPGARVGSWLRDR